MSRFERYHSFYKKLSSRIVERNRRYAIELLEDYIQSPDYKDDGREPRKYLEPMFWEVEDVREDGIHFLYRNCRCYSENPHEHRFLLPKAWIVHHDLVGVNLDFKEEAPKWPK